MGVATKTVPTVPESTSFVAVVLALAMGYRNMAPAEVLNVGALIVTKNHEEKETAAPGAYVAYVAYSSRGIVSGTPSAYAKPTTIALFCVDWYLPSCATVQESADVASSPLKSLTRRELLAAAAVSHAHMLSRMFHWFAGYKPDADKMDGVVVTAEPLATCKKAALVALTAPVASVTSTSSAAAQTRPSAHVMSADVDTRTISAVDPSVFHAARAPGAASAQSTSAPSARARAGGMRGGGGARAQKKGGRASARARAGRGGGGDARARRRRAEQRWPRKEMASPTTRRSEQSGQGRK
jgi:hypothetical protein